MVNMHPETWDTTDMVYRQPEHWQAVTVRSQYLHAAQPGFLSSTLHASKPQGMKQELCSSSYELQQLLCERAYTPCWGPWKGFSTCPQPAPYLSC